MSSDSFELTDGRLLSRGDDGWRLWTADGAPIGGLMNWREAQRLHIVEYHDGRVTGV